MQGKYSAKEITKILLLLLGGGALVVTLVAFPGLGYALKPFLKDTRYKPSRISQTLKRLEKQKMISISETKDEVKITLLDKGQKKIISYKIDELKIRKGRWDKIWRIVIFDVPEGKRLARDYLRAKLKELGFYTLQKSVLVTPWECQKIIDFIRLNYEVGDNVKLILAKNFEGEEKARTYFNV